MKIGYCLTMYNVHKDMTHLSQMWPIYQRYKPVIRYMTSFSEIWPTYQRYIPFNRNMAQLLFYLENGCRIIQAVQEVKLTLLIYLSSYISRPQHVTDLTWSVSRCGLTWLLNKPIYIYLCAIPRNYPYQFKMNTTKSEKSPLSVYWTCPQVSPTCLGQCATRREFASASYTGPELRIVANHAVPCSVQKS